MSRRFIAPESRGSTGSIQTISSPSSGLTKDHLPPPAHPALARPRAPSPGPETYGALNRPPPPPPHPSRGASPAPPIPSRPPTTHSNTTSSIPIYSLDTQPSANVPPDVSTPVLLVTTDTETLPPYSSEPNLASQTWPVEPPMSAPDTLGLQASSMSIAPPLHPSRQPSPGPELRHRAHSSTNIDSARTLDSNTLARRPPLEHSRHGSTASVLTLKDNTLTDDDLRKMYDAEEVERYLRLFASRVNEVAMDPEHPDASTHVQDEGEWVSVSNTWSCTRNPAPLPPHLANPQTFFQYIAAIVYPYVVVPRPQSTETKRKFKLNRAASSAQRLYLAAYPAYVPTLVYLCHLATWRDTRKSAMWCAVFWAAWAGGFLSQFVVGRLLYLLYTGGHVTREEIQRRRVAAREAEKLGKAIEGGIPGVGITGELGVWEVTKLVTGLGKKKAKKAKAAAVEVVGENADEEDMEDWKLMLIDVADELADLHERIKNIFLHRRPELTRFYIFLLSLVFIGTFLVQDSSRVVTMVLGFWFWFIPPVVKQLPKLPSPFSFAPTDAEVAMELISKRVERGERVVPERISKRKKTKPAEPSKLTVEPGKRAVEPGKLAVEPGKLAISSRSTLDLSTSLVASPSSVSLVDGSSDDEADLGLVVPSRGAPQEDKLRKGAVRAWNWLGRTKQMIDQTRGVEAKVYARASPEQSFPAQHRSRPGMLMISSELLTFTPLFTSNGSGQPQDPRTIKVDIDHLRGVKKVSPGGLSVRYVNAGEVVEEKFLLVVGRDEAFATLVGWGGGRWKNV